MRNARVYGAAVIALLMFVATLTPVLAARSESTVGDFIVAFAKARNLNATDVQIATESLSAAGIRLPADLNASKRLTEADVARIARTAGLNVTTTNPSAPFDGEQVERFFQTFAAELGSGDGLASGTLNGDDDDDGGGGPPFDPLTKGKKGGKGKGKYSTTPSEPE